MPRLQIQLLKVFFASTISIKRLSSLLRLQHSFHLCCITATTRLLQFFDHGNSLLDRFTLHPCCHRRQAIIHCQFGEHSLLAHFLPGRLILDLVSNHYIALLTRLFVGQGSHRHHFRLTGLLGELMIGLLIIVAAGPQEAGLPGAFVYHRHLLKSGIFRQNGPGYVHRFRDVKVGFVAADRH